MDQQQHQQPGFHQPVPIGQFMDPNTIRQIATKHCGPAVRLDPTIINSIMGNVHTDVNKILAAGVQLSQARAKKYVQVLNRPSEGRAILTVDDLQAASTLVLNRTMPGFAHQHQNSLDNSRKNRKRRLNDQHLHAIEKDNYETQNKIAIAMDINGGRGSNSEYSRMEQDLFPAIAIGLAGGHKEKMAFVKKTQTQAYAQQIHSFKSNYYSSLEHTLPIGMQITHDMNYINVGDDDEGVCDDDDSVNDTVHDNNSSTFSSMNNNDNIDNDDITHPDMIIHNDNNDGDDDNNNDDDLGHIQGNQRQLAFSFLDPRQPHLKFDHLAYIEPSMIDYVQQHDPYSNKRMMGDVTGYGHHHGQFGSQLESLSDHDDIDVVDEMNVSQYPMNDMDYNVESSLDQQQSSQQQGQRQQEGESDEILLLKQQVLQLKQQLMNQQPSQQQQHSQQYPQQNSQQHGFPNESNMMNDGEDHHNQNNNNNDNINNNNNNINLNNNNNNNIDAQQQQQQQPRDQPFNRQSLNSNNGDGDDESQYNQFSQQQQSQQDHSQQQQYSQQQYHHDPHNQSTTSLNTSFSTQASRHNTPTKPTQDGSTTTTTTTTKAPKPPKEPKVPKPPKEPKPPAAPKKDANGMDIPPAEPKRRGRPPKQVDPNDPNAVQPRVRSKKAAAGATSTDVTTTGPNNGAATGSMTGGGSMTTDLLRGGNSTTGMMTSDFLSTTTPSLVTGGITTPAVTGGTTDPTPLGDDVSVGEQEEESDGVEQAIKRQRQV